MHRSEQGSSIPGPCVVSSIDYRPNRFLSMGQRDSQSPNKALGKWVHPLLQNGATPRSIELSRRVASLSRGVITFQMPQLFSTIPARVHEKIANCRSFVCPGASDPRC